MPETTPFTHKSIPDQLIHLLAAQHELPVPVVRDIGRQRLWKSVGTDNDNYSISLFAKEPGKAGVPVLGWLSAKRLRFIALHFLVAAEALDDNKDQGAE